MTQLSMQEPAPFQGVADDLVAKGWSVLTDAFAMPLVSRLSARCHALWQADDLSPAAVGRGPSQQVIPERRGDFTRWLDDCPPDAAQDEYLQLIDALRLTLNGSLFLGLDTFETHYALYPPGAGYERHLDRFQDNPLRTVSVVSYLNTGWQPGDGGELRLYLPDTEIDVAPRAGTLVVFLSDQIEHAVLPARFHRASLVGWFRRRPDNPLLR